MIMATTTTMMMMIEIEKNGRPLVVPCYANKIIILNCKIQMILKKTTTTTTIIAEQQYINHYNKTSINSKQLSNINMTIIRSIQNGYGKW